MQGLLDRVAQEDPTVQIVDIDWNRDLAQEHHIEQIPTFCVFEDGKEVRRRTGRMSEKEFLRFIEKNEDPRQADSNGPEDVSIPLPAEVTSRTFIRDANLINPGGVARTDSVMMEAAGNGPHLRIEGAPHESSSQSPHVFAVLCLGGLGGIHHGLGIPQPASACLCRRSEAETRDRPFWGSDRAAGGACRRNAA
jgi:hypothetical protein